MRLNWRKALMALLLGGTLFSSGCGDIVVRSVKTGLFGYISGSVGNSIAGGQLNALLNNLLTGGLFTGNSGSGANI